MKSEWYAIVGLVIVASLVFLVSFLGYLNRVKWDREYDEQHRHDGWHI